MKKLAVSVVLLVAVVWGAVAVAQAVRNTPERRLCTRVGELCNQPRDPRQLDACMENVRQLRRSVGNEAVDHTERCVEQVNSCGGAMGCVAGGTVRGVGTFLRDFGDGLSR